MAWIVCFHCEMFVPRSRVKIFHNKRTRSNPLDPKLMFWCVSYDLGAFGTVKLPYETQGKTGRTSAKVRATKSSRIFFRDERIQSTPLEPKVMFWRVSYHLGAFRTIMLPYETRGKTFRICVKVRATKSCRSFSRRTHPIHPIGPQTHVLVRFIPFGCIWDHLVALRNSVQNGPN